ncbi:uncharacterized protein BDW43DRAFT_304273 [Aspergillus alliaceus]|uniref:uncharacterized protein n=1 Tax=Petromyces alliaceus TaxID=209559 RepID=UPI0012A4FAB7|nr:uncharacterized protein BDW43DRAFT_304273 [Aspergillus alliaceus]KAB8227878.1 hypothetical protein BDW43DRAFT_304273 [Aspergillus alliaceus]
MSVTINSNVVGLDGMIPRIIDREREDEDVERLVPWVFQHSDIVDEDRILCGPKEDCKFGSVFYYLLSYRCNLQGNAFDDTGISNVFVPSETITLPRKSWHIPGREPSKYLIHDQCTISKMLIETIYVNLSNVKEQDPKVEFTTHGHELRYTIGGQTWNGLLRETFSTMLGQLTKNLSILDTGFQDQEVFIVGFHGPYLHIARGFFAKDLISRVYAQGHFDQEPVSLQFTRSYNLFLKEDWLEVTRVLTRLLRYLLSGKSKVGVVQKHVK